MYDLPAKLRVHKSDLAEKMSLPNYYLRIFPCISNDEGISRAYKKADFVSRSCFSGGECTDPPRCMNHSSTNSYASERCQVFALCHMLGV
ncbi:hypothetical protein OIDMADRAFT_19762 [Oidiodendron maius Zn]|uniref:Uncharacterized protein n=1 Tax=Oidiodendron maius (strain Zn) TaxID=913774 RepID=A0A0C3GUK1_OIDMZ|nr:hypothetical protein OIDMADRAFT_19762 [Oidiodendron maius Zn]